MIDPDNIILAKKNQDTKIELQDLPTCDVLVWDLDDPKETRRYFTTIERQIRNSPEYRHMIHFLKSRYDMDQCAFIKYDDSEGSNIKIEVHHSPFTLLDIVVIVYKKRIYYQEPLTTAMVAKECTMLHYKLLVGLIPLSRTAHQLVHAGKLFIPVTNVYGDYRAFISTYKQFCDEEQLETITRIEKYSTEYSELQDTTIFDQNPITINNMNPQYQLPNFNSIQDRMIDRSNEIRQNGYKLPTLEDYQHKIADSTYERESVAPEILVDNTSRGIDVLFFVET